MTRPAKVSVNIKSAEVEEGVSSGRRRSGNAEVDLVEDFDNDEEDSLDKLHRTAEMKRDYLLLPTLSRVEQEDLGSGSTKSQQSRTFWRISWRPTWS